MFNAAVEVIPPVALIVVAATAAGVVAPTVPLILIGAVPVRFSATASPTLKRDHTSAAVLTKTECPYLPAIFSDPRRLLIVTPAPATNEVLPTPNWKTGRTELIGNATEEFGGTVTEFADPLFIVSRF